MLVDLARNDLGRVAKAGTRARRSLSCDRALQPHHAHRERCAWRGGAGSMMSSICLRRPFRRARWSARRKCAPCRSSTSSSPWAAACTAARWVTSARQGDMDQAITIRTLVFSGDQYSYQAGAGIVADSSPRAEYEEAHGEERRDAPRARARGGGPMSARARILLIDNYDSFTYNLVQAFLVLGAEVDVSPQRRHHGRSRARRHALAPVHLAGTRDAARRRCVHGHDPRLRGAHPRASGCASAISRSVEVFGGKVVRAARLMHGKTSPVSHDGKGLFSGLPQHFRPAAITR